MIAEIDSQSDISIYLKNSEVKSLSQKEVIAGIIVRNYRPDSQGIIRVQVDNNRQDLNGFGIGIDDEKYYRESFELDIFIGDYYFSELKKRGRTGTRQKMRDGSKINLYSKLDFGQKFSVDFLEDFVKNKK